VLAHGPPGQVLAYAERYANFNDPLERIEDEVVPGVIATTARIHVVPLLVVDGNPHFWRIAMVQAVAAAVVLLSPEILWVVDVGVVVEAIPIMGIALSSPTASVRSLVGRCGIGYGHIAARQHGGDQKMTEHHGFPPKRSTRSVPFAPAKCH